LRAGLLQPFLFKILVGGEPTCPKRKVDWRIRVADAAETIYKEASDLKDFLSLFFGFGAARLPQVRPVASVVETVIERLNRIMNKAVTIVQEISKKK
jgi:hypothetical protein